MKPQRTQILRASIAEQKRKLDEAKCAFVFEKSPDELDRASCEENINVMTIFVQRAQSRLMQLERRVSELEHQSGSYCIDCGEEISARRLAACPDALRCTQCQEQWENEQKQRRRQFTASSPDVFVRVQA